MVEKVASTIIKCPDCGNEITAQRYNIMNCAEDPSIKEKLLNRSLFTHTCPNCGKKMMLNFDFTFCDPINKYVVQRVTTMNMEVYKEILAGSDVIRKAGYKVRVVPDVNVAVEKITAFDAGISDVLTELVKWNLMASAKKQEREIEAMFFNRYDAEKDELVYFYISKKGNGTVHANYAKAKERFKNFPNDIGSLIVDIGHINEYAKLMNERKVTV